MPLIKVNDRILVIGCGNSEFSQQLFEEGYRNITNIDISETLITRMKHEHRDKIEMKWEQMDMLAMSFETNSFDVAIDKATMDVLQCDNGDCWNPSAEVMQRVSLFYQNCFRVLKQNGRIIQISFDQPHFRKIYLRDVNCSLDVRSIPGGVFPYYLYLLDKLD